MLFGKLGKRPEQTLYKTAFGVESVNEGAALIFDRLPESSLYFYSIGFDINREGYGPGNC